MNKPRFRDKESLAAKLLLWLALLCLLLPPVYLRITANAATVTAENVFLWFLLCLIWVCLAGTGIVFLLIFLHSGYRTRTHTGSFIVCACLVLIGNLITIFCSLDIPLVRWQCAVFTLPALPILWVLCLWLELPLWLLRSLHAVPGIFFTLSLFLDGNLGLLHIIQIAYLLYIAACVVIIPKTVHLMRETPN